MKTIGITGGVGAGKSEVLAYLSSHYKAKIIMADEVGHLVKEPGQECYKPLIELLGEDILQEDGFINKTKMAEKIFADKECLKKVNEMIHPAVVSYILKKIEEERKKREADFFFVEAALLIENHFDEILDELWYIYADENIRRKRLKTARNYPDEKITEIMSRQLKDEEFRKNCFTVIDNSGAFSNTKIQIDEKLGEYLWQK